MYFHIIEEAKTEADKYGDARLVWTNFSTKLRLGNKLAKCKLDDVTRNPKGWITDLGLLRGDLHKLDVNIDNSEMMNHILPNLPE